MTVAILVGMFVAVGVLLVLHRSIGRIALGFILLQQGINVMLLAAGGIRRRDPPIAGEAAAVADPLPQAFVLTAIVIGLGLVAVILTIAFRAGQERGDDDSEP